MQKQRNNEIHYSFTKSVVPLNQDFPVSLITHNAKDDPLSNLHCHNVMEIGLCLKGGGVFIIDNSVFNYQKGDMIFIKPDIYHRARSSNHKDDLWHFIYMDLKDWPAHNSMPGLKPLIPHRDEPELYHIIKIICDEMLSQKTEYQPVVRNLMGALMNMLPRFSNAEHIDEDQEKSIRTNVTDLRIIKAMDLIISSGSEQYPIEELAEMCNLSASHFRLLFKEHIGIGPKQFQTKIKIRKAMNLLRENRFRIVDISFECGFQSLSSFNRHFKEETGISPLKWRDKYGN